MGKSGVVRSRSRRLCLAGHQVTASAGFSARYEGTCPRCHREIEVGEHVRFVEDELMHYRHEIVERVAEICNTCWLTKPCDCA